MARMTQINVDQTKSDLCKFLFLRHLRAYFGVE